MMTIELKRLEAERSAVRLERQALLEAIASLSAKADAALAEEARLTVAIDEAFTAAARADEARLKSPWLDARGNFREVHPSERASWPVAQKRAYWNAYEANRAALCDNAVTLVNDLVDEDSAKVRARMLRDLARATGGVNQQEWPSIILRKLEIMQRMGGMPSQTTALQNLHIPGSRRSLTAKQQARVWNVLETHCTDRGFTVGGIRLLGTPYAITTDANGVIVPAGGC